GAGAPIGIQLNVAGIGIITGSATVVVNSGANFFQDAKDLSSNIEKNKDKAKSDNATKAAEEASGAKLINSADDVVYNGKSVDKAFGKHGKDFGSYPDGSSSSVKLFEQDVKELINTGVQKSGTWYGKQGTHIYNPTTKQWTFINEDGTFNTAFKLSSEQFNYLIKTGVVR
ncbi:hypothetical protein AF112_14340, partial [Listeria monocytogenes]|nr:hypothetical protein [Listeria monocytogenes]EAF5967844.1 hypothetical protein [Listeria monocytogenes]